MTEALPRSGSFVEDHFQDASCLRQASHCFKEVYIAHPAEVFSGSQVLLHVYELFEFVRVNKILASELLPLGGALHAGVEVYGREWSYGGSSGSGTGIVCEVPRTNRKHRYRESIPLGYTRLTKAEVALVLGDLVEVWHGEDYHWLNNNCLSFANAFCRKLGVGGIPAWIDRLPRGVSAVKQGMQCVAERVRDLADGTLEVVHAIVEGKLDCASCRPAPSFASSFDTQDAPGSFMLTPAFGASFVHHRLANASSREMAAVLREDAVQAQPRRTRQTRPVLASVEEDYGQQLTNC